MVEGNYIGSDVTGTTYVPNGAFNGNDIAGVQIDDSAGNTIGGTATGAGNLISGNVGGIQIIGSSATGNSVLGNLIGTNASDSGPLQNYFGVSITFAADNTIGGTTSTPET